MCLVVLLMATLRMETQPEMVDLGDDQHRIWGGGTCWREWWKRWIEMDRDGYREKYKDLGWIIYAHLENKHPPIVFFCVCFFLTTKHTTSVSSAFFSKKKKLPHLKKKTFPFLGQKNPLQWRCLSTKTTKKHTPDTKRLTGWVLLLHPDV